MADHVYQVVVNWNIGGQFASNILHWSFNDGGFTSTAEAAKALMDAFATHSQTQILNTVPTSTTLLSYRSRCVNQTGGFESTKQPGAGVTGARTGNLMAAGQGACIIGYPVGNSKRRGRLFLPGVTDSDCINGILTTAYKNALTTNVPFWYSTLVLTGGGGVTATAGLWSRLPKPLGTFETYQAFQVSDMVAEMRRRQVPA